MPRCAWRCSAASTRLFRTNSLCSLSMIQWLLIICTPTASKRSRFVTWRVTSIRSKRRLMRWRLWKRGKASERRCSSRAKLWTPKTANLLRRVFTFGGWTARGTFPKRHLHAGRRCVTSGEADSTQTQSRCTRRSRRIRSVLSFCPGDTLLPLSTGRSFFPKHAK